MNADLNLEQSTFERSKNKIEKRRWLYTFAKSLFFVPDSIMLKIQYRIKNHRMLHMSNPVRFTEKLQYYKAYYRNDEMLDCVDKYLVRAYVEKKMGTNKYLNTLYQVCDTADEIDFDILPKSFVIKTSDGGNGDNILICTDKSTLNKKEVVDLVNSWRNKKYYVISREWAYNGAKKSKVIIEKLLESDENSDGSIDDYKFLCYNGKFRYLWVDKDRYSNHKRGFWDEKLNFLTGVYSDHPTFDKPIKLPENIQEMIAVSEKLANGFPFVRVDLYNIGGQIIFGEMTFYPWSGYVQYTPDNFDYDLGKYFDVNFKK